MVFCYTGLLRRDGRPHGRSQLNVTPAQCVCAGLGEGTYTEDVGSAEEVLNHLDKLELEVSKPNRLKVAKVLWQFLQVPSAFPSGPLHAFSFPSPGTREVSKAQCTPSCAPASVGLT